MSLRSRDTGNATIFGITAYYQAPSEARGVVIGGSEYVKSCGTSRIDSEMAGPITMKLSGIDRGNSVTVLGRVRGGMNQDS